MKMKILTSSFILVFFLSFFSCKDTEQLSYTKDIQPLLTSCSNAYCHGAYHPDGNTLNFENTVIFAGEEKFLAAIKHENGFEPMPKGGDKLPTADIELIETWINQGMPE